MFFDLQTTFNQLTDHSRFISWIESTLGLSNVTFTTLESLLCKKCNQIPTLVCSNGSSHRYHFALRLSCSSCNAYWNYCKCCTSINQPPTFHCYFRRQIVENSRLTVGQIQRKLDLSVHTHCECHPVVMNTDVMPQQESGVDDNHFDGHDERGDNDVEVFVVDIISNMFNVPNPSLFDLKLKDAVIERETHKKYPDYLIKRYWLKNTNCSLRRDEVILFYSYIKFIMKQSLNENTNISFILESWKKRKEIEISRIRETLMFERQKVDLAHETIRQLQNQLLSNGINPVVDLDDVLRTLLQPVADTNEKSTNDICLGIPISVPDIRKVLEREHSLVRNILIPPITLHESGISYVKPSDVLRLALCFGVPFDIVPGKRYSTDILHKRSIYRSPLIRKKIQDSDIEEDVITVVYGFWSDGCYCGTESKGKRNQAKMTTIHIAHYSVTQRHVFPIMFGRKGDSDEEVKKIIIMDMENLAQQTVKCYIPTLMEVRKVRFLLGYALQDRPEHAETTSFMGSTGKFSRYIGLSCPIITDYKENLPAYSPCKALRSCSDCWNKRVELLDRGLFHETARSRRCRHCYDWDLRSVEYVHHEDYPVTVVPPEEISAFNNDALLAKDITFASMRLACHTIYTKVSNGEWTQATTEHFARRECIRVSVWKKVWKRANEVARNNENVENIPLDESMFPAFWNQNVLSLQDFQLGIMHYLFLNVGKHLLDIVNLRLSEEGLWSHAFPILDSQLLSIRRMCLSWCKGWTLGSYDYPASMWVAENFVGFSIVCKSICTSLFRLPRPITDMTELTELLDSYYCLCALAMSPDEPDEQHYKRVSSVAKCFLSCVHTFCERIQRQSVNKVESTSCFINLLSLSDKMKEYGILRNYWEGGYRGEGIFRPLKDLVTRGLHATGISQHIMKKQYQHLMIDELLQMKEREDDYVSLLEYELRHSNNDTDGDNENPNTTDDENLYEHSYRFRRFKLYKSWQHALSEIEAKQSISCAQHIDSRDCYVIVGYKTRNKEMFRINFSEWDVVKNTNVCNVTLDEEPHLLNDISRSSKGYLSCLVLPFTFEDNIEEEPCVYLTKYFIVNEEHREMEQDGEWVFPSLDLQQKEVTMNLNGQGQQVDLEAFEICSDRQRCEAFINRSVAPLPDLPYGKVVSFKYLRRIVSVQTAVWTIKYYCDVNGEGNARKKVMMTYNELIRSIVNE